MEKSSDFLVCRQTVSTAVCRFVYFLFGCFSVWESQCTKKWHEKYLITSTNVVYFLLLYCVLLFLPPLTMKVLAGAKISGDRNQRQFFWVGFGMKTETTAAFCIYMTNAVLTFHSLFCTQSKQRIQMKVGMVNKINGKVYSCETSYSMWGQFSSYHMSHWELRNSDRFRSFIVFAIWSISKFEKAKLKQKTKGNKSTVFG